MASIWFTLFIVELVTGIQAYFKAKKQRNQNVAAFTAMTQTVRESLHSLPRRNRNMTGEEAAEFYLQGVGRELYSWDFDQFMTELCKTHGLHYVPNDAATGSFNSERMPSELRHELARRVSTALGWNVALHHASPETQERHDHKHPREGSR